MKESNSSYMFSQELYHKIATLILDDEEEGYTLLCEKARDNLEGVVSSWCFTNNLDTYNDAQDAMGEILAHLCAKIVTYYLRKPGTYEEGSYNQDHEGLHSWILKLATNRLKNFVKSRHNYMNRLEFSIDADPETDGGTRYEPATDGGLYTTFRREEATRRLRESVNHIIMNKKTSVHIILAWLCHSLLMYEGMDPIVANRATKGIFAESTLFLMYEKLLKAGEKIEWLKLTVEQKEKIETALNRPWDTDTKIGNVKFECFFMKKGGESTVSDWRNKIAGSLVEAFGRLYCMEEI